MRNPAELLRSLRQISPSGGCGIALDDVGAVPDSLPSLPFLAPDVIKLDIPLVQRWPDAGQARILTAVAAYAEQSGATVLAEGIETEAHLQQSLALGATLGQGWYFSRPGPLRAYPPPHQPILLLDARVRNGGTPFELLDPRRVRIGQGPFAVDLTPHRKQGLVSRHRPWFSPRSRVPAGSRPPPPFVSETWPTLPLVVALAAGMNKTPREASEVRTFPLATLCAANGPSSSSGAHYTGALIAKI